MSEIRTAQNTVANGTRTAIRNTTYTEQTSGAQRSVSSTSAQDGPAGTGIKSVKVVYYDGNMDGPREEVVVLNGTTPVPTVATDICYVERMEAVESGVSGLTAGTIRLHPDNAGASTAFASISAADVRTRYSHHYVPTGRTMNLKGMVASCMGSGFLVDGIFRKYSIPVGAPYYAFQPVCASFRVDNAGGPSVVGFEDPTLLFGPGKFELYGKSDNALTGGTVYADFTFYET